MPVTRTRALVTVTVMALSCALVCASCEPRSATALVARFSTDVDPSRVRRVALTLRWDEPGATEFAVRDYVLGAPDGGNVLRFPGSVVIAPVDAREAARDRRTLRVEATLFTAAADGTTRAYTSARALVRLAAERSVSVDLFFADLCGSSGTGMRCASSESCVVDAGAARCEPLVVRDSLPDYAPDASLGF